MKTNLSLIIAPLLLISCSKRVESPEQDIYINFSKEDLAYVQIPENKYCIYKDSATGETDSVVVTQSEVSTGFTPATQGTGLFDPIPLSYYSQTFTLLLTKVKGNTSTDWFYGTANARNAILQYYDLASTDTAHVWLVEKDRSRNAEKLYVFDELFSKDKRTIIPNMTIEGNDYTDVVEFITNNGIASTNPNYNAYYESCAYYWAKGSGIIKRTLTSANTTQTWTLLRKG